MTISWRTPGAWASGSTSLTPALPASVGDGDRMFLFVGCKPYSATINQPTGWTRIGTQQTNGTTGSGTDSGSVAWSVFYRDWQSGDSAPSVSVTSGNVSLGCIHGAIKTEAAWDTAVAYFGSDTSSGTGYSITAASSSGQLKAGDGLIHASVIAGDNSTFGSPTITATSATIGTVTESPATEGTTTTGNDLEASSASALVTAGLSTADAVCGWTLSVAQTGGSALIRVRELKTVSAGQGSLSITGQSPTFSMSANIIRSPAQGALTITGQTPTITTTTYATVAISWLEIAPSTTTTISPAQGALVVTGQSPTISKTENVFRSPAQGSLTLTGQAPTTRASLSRAPGQGTLTVTGQNPTIARTANIWRSPSQGALTITGQAPTIIQAANVTRAPGQGTLTFTGQAPTVSKTNNIQRYPAQGSLTLTGQVPTISRTEHLWRSIGQGSIVITGQAPTITTYAGITRQPGQGSLTLIGQAPSIGITAHHRVAPQAGQIVLDGLAPVVTNTTPPLFTQDQLDFLLAYMEANLMIWDEPIEGVMTAREMMRILLAAIAGKRAGLGTATEQYMAQDGTTPRVTFTPTDASGNGNTVLDGS